MAKRFLLRLSEDLFEEIRHWAADDLRSVNGQIEFLLRQALRQSKRTREDDQETSGEEV